MTTTLRTVIDRHRGFMVSEDGRAEARRFYRTHGHTFSGWVVRDHLGGYSDPIATKTEAKQVLATWGMAEDGTDELEPRDPNQDAFLRALAAAETPDEFVAVAARYAS